MQPLWLLLKKSLKKEIQKHSSLELQFESVWRIYNWINSLNQSVHWINTKLHSVMEYLNKYLNKIRTWQRENNLYENPTYLFNK